jgi:anti-sigma factor RsiW
MMCDDVERDLDPYVDRELEADAAAAIREHLRSCATCQRRVAEREALGRLVRSTPYHVAPDRLRARVATTAARSAASRQWLTWAAAAVLVLAVGGGLTVVRSRMDRQASADGAVDEVVNGHVRSLMADHLFDVQSTDQHTVKPWFLGKLDFSPPVVDLASLGYPLIGGRLDYLSGHAVAALVYERRKHTINVFVSPAREGPSADEVRSVRGFHVHHWVRDSMTYWVVSDLNDTELGTFVRALQSP